MNSSDHVEKKSYVVWLLNYELWIPNIPSSTFKIKVISITKVLPPGKKRSFRLDSGNPGNERENDREKTAFWGVVKPGIREFFPIPGADVCLPCSNIHFASFTIPSRQNLNQELISGILYFTFFFLFLSFELFLCLFFDEGFTFFRLFGISLSL